MRNTALWVRNDTRLGLICLLGHSPLLQGIGRAALEHNLSDEYHIPSCQQLVYRRAFRELVVLHPDLIKSRVEFRMWAHPHPRLSLPEGLTHIYSVRRNRCARCPACHGYPGEKLQDIGRKWIFNLKCV